MRQASAAYGHRATFFLKPILALLTAFAVSLAASGEAAAAKGKYAAIVIDANTGKTLFSANADAARYPASLTKMMTLYMVFERLASGKLKKSTQIPFSKHAASMAPTKLGVRAGGKVSVETIIYSLVTRSANDAAAAVAEHIGGSEAAFARMMTDKARSLGMKNTEFRNASGLPNSAQHTTARDMAILGIALREHFPQYYSYFATRSFTYGRQRMANHNRLLGRIEGVDGIKTGYTRASGFNLVSSVADGKRRIVAVVMGGQTGRSRDNHMADLIRKYLPKASGRGGGGDLVAKVEPAEPAKVAEAAPPKVVKKASKAASKADLRIAQASAAPDAQTVTEILEATEPTVQAYAQPAAKKAKAALDAIDPMRTSSTGGAPSGWSVQVASIPDEAKAKAKLASIGKLAAAVLEGSDAYTMPFEKDGTTYYRVRYGGFSSKSAAWNACGALKKKKISCYAVLE